jgi:hypothetical protein
MRIVAHVDAVQVGGGVVPVVAAPAVLFCGYAVGIDAGILPFVAVDEAEQCIHVVPTSGLSVRTADASLSSG